MNISITTVLKWADYDKCEWNELPKPFFQVCSAYDNYADMAIEKRGASTMIRCFASMATNEDAKILEESHEEAKQDTVNLFNDILSTYNEEYEEYRKACDIVYGDRPVQPKEGEPGVDAYWDWVETYVSAKEAVERYERNVEPQHRRTY